MQYRATKFHKYCKKNFNVIFVGKATLQALDVGPSVNQIILYECNFKYLLMETYKKVRVGKKIIFNKDIS